MRRLRGVPFQYVHSAPNTPLRIAEMQVKLTPIFNLQRYHLWFLHPEYWPGALAAGTPYFVVLPMGRGV